MLHVPLPQWLHETAGCFLPSPSDSWHGWEGGTFCLMSPPYEVTSRRRNHTGKCWGKFLDKQNSSISTGCLFLIHWVRIAEQFRQTPAPARRRKSGSMMLCGHGYHPSWHPRGTACLHAKVGAASSEMESIPPSCHLANSRNC